MPSVSSARLQEGQTLLSALNRDVSSYIEEQVPLLIDDSTKLQVTRILNGDYNLKIARQDYFTSNQDQVCLHGFTMKP